MPEISIMPAVILGVVVALSASAIGMACGMSFGHALALYSFVGIGTLLLSALWLYLRPQH
ncbi:hypothetical protein [Paracoccus ravus]|uniref:hypothetical protein n=1 Tax=Paracoccus ravus TaxID=2447760 RepID=UPI00106EACBA|nr:hypothetical protein [Paracoccus ravus]